MHWLHQPGARPFTRHPVQGPAIGHREPDELAIGAQSDPVSPFEQLAILEPALSETVGATFALALREATDEAVRRGVPKQAAIDFIIGHLNIEC